MAKKIKTVAGTDGYEYPVTSYELVVDENGESVRKVEVSNSVSSGLPSFTELLKKYLHGNAEDFLDWFF